MLFNLIVLLVSGFSLAFVGLVIFYAASHRLALLEFKRKSRNLPMVPGARLLGNHAAIVFIGHRNCQNLQDSHKKLGQTIGWLNGSQFCASTTDLDLIKLIVKDEGSQHLGEMIPCLPIREFEDSLLTATGEEWHLVRQAVAPALKPNKFLTPNVSREINESIEKLIDFIDRRLDSNGADQIFNIDDLIARFSLTLVFKCFYKQNDLVDFDDPKDKWTEMTESGFAAMNEPAIKFFILNFPILRNLFDWICLHFTKLGSIRKLTLELVRNQSVLAIQARQQLHRLKRAAREKGVEFNPDDFHLDDGTKFRRNMIDHVIDQYLDKKLTKEQYVNNTCFLLAAAQRTASDCMVHTIYRLSIDQDRQDKLRSSIFADGIDSEYLEWVLMESLRLLPPVTAGCSRTISRDIKLPNGHVLPKDTYVVTNAYVIHRLTEYWGDDADEFRPERWDDTSNHHPMQYIPFGAGLRNCPGSKFAMHIMKMMFVEILARYRFVGEPRDDAYEFDAPILLYILPNSATRVKICRV